MGSDSKKRYAELLNIQSFVSAEQDMQLCTLRCDVVVPKCMCVRVAVQTTMQGRNKGAMGEAIGKKQEKAVLSS